MQPLYASQSALGSGGIKFIDENGGGPGVRLEAQGEWRVR
jgi:hypothetical protein